jgi:hypothetical protein
MKNTSHRRDDTRCGTEPADSSVADSPLPTFTIDSLERVEFGSKRAIFKVLFPHVDLDCDLFIPVGKAPFAMPGSIRSKFTGAYQRTTRLSTELQEAITAEALRLYGVDGDFE